MSSPIWIWRNTNKRVRRIHKEIFRLRPGRYSRWQDVSAEQERKYGWLRDVDDQVMLPQPHRQGRRHKFLQRDPAQWHENKLPFCIRCNKPEEASAHRR